MNHHLLKKEIIKFLSKIGILKLIRPFHKIVGDRRYLYYFTQGSIIGLDLREKIKNFEKKAVFCIFLEKSQKISKTSTYQR